MWGGTREGLVHNTAFSEQQLLLVAGLNATGECPGPGWNGASGLFQLDGSPAGASKRQLTLVLGRFPQGLLLCWLIPQLSQAAKSVATWSSVTRESPWERRAGIGWLSGVRWWSTRWLRCGDLSGGPPHLL